jgi:hypothetical protein
MPPEMRITDLPDLVQALPPRVRALANRIFDISATTGRLDPPEAMHAWIERSFGSVDAVREQRIVKVTNRVTLQGTLFNGLRASRPLDTGVSVGFEREIEATAGDPFCRPEEGTPADVFGRVRGEHSVTASNVAKYDGFHGSSSSTTTTPSISPLKKSPTTSPWGSSGAARSSKPTRRPATRSSCGTASGGLEAP